MQNMENVDKELIKVLHVVWSGNFGGIGRIVMDIMTEQKKDTYLQIGLFIGKNNGVLINEFKKIIPNCHISNLSGGFDINLWKYIKILWVFREYKILHFHSFNPFLFYAGVILRKKIVFTEHGNFGFGRKKRITDGLKLWLFKFGLNQCTHFISFNSSFSKELAEERYGLKKTNRKIIYNGINFANISIKKINQGIDEKILANISGKFVVGTCSRFAKVKKIERLIQGFAKFSFRKESILLLVGDGELRAELEKLVVSTGISNNTVFTGYRSEVAPYQAVMDIAVFPSKNESFGLVAIETLALGKPTIVFRDGGGITDIIEGVCPEDIVDNEEALLKRFDYYFSRRTDDGTEMKNIRVRYAHQFNVKNTAAELSDIYRKTLNAR